MSLEGIQLGEVGKEITVGSEIRNRIHHGMLRIMAKASIPDLMNARPELFNLGGSNSLLSGIDSSIGSFRIRDDNLTGFRPGTLGESWIDFVAQRDTQYSSSNTTFVCAASEREWPYANIDMLANGRGDFFMSSMSLAVQDAKVPGVRRHELGLYFNYVESSNRLDIFEKPPVFLSDSDFDLLVGIFTRAAGGDTDEGFLKPSQIRSLEKIEEAEYRYRFLANPDLFFSALDPDTAVVTASRLMTPEESQEYANMLNALLGSGLSLEVVCSNRTVRYQAGTSEEAFNQYNPKGAVLDIAVRYNWEERESLESTYLPVVVHGAKGEIIGGTTVAKHYSRATEEPWYEIALDGPFAQKNRFNAWRKRFQAGRK